MIKNFWIDNKKIKMGNINVYYLYILVYFYRCIRIFYLRIFKCFVLLVIINIFMYNY